MSEENTKKREYFTQETRAKAAAALKERWKDPEFRAKHLGRLSKGHLVKSERKKEACAKTLRDYKANNPEKVKAINKELGKKLHLPENVEKSKIASKQAMDALFEQVGYTPGMKNLCRARDLKEKNVTYAQIADTYLKYAKQGHLPFKICNLIAEEFGLPSLTAKTLHMWASNGHPEIKEAIDAGRQYIAMTHVDYMRKGLGLDKVKWMMNVFCGIYETSAMKHDINAQVEVNGKMEVKAVSLGDLRQKKE